MLNSESLPANPVLLSKIHPKSTIQHLRFRHSLPATRHSGCAAIPLPAKPANPVLLSKIHPKSKIHHSKSKIFLPPIHPVALFATTPGSRFVEMILHLPIHHSKFKIQNCSASARYPLPAKVTHLRYNQFVLKFLYSKLQG
jgi:hypothetical protein